MDNKSPSIPELDLVVYEQNRRRIPAEVLEPYAGQWVAFSPDGTRVVAHGSRIEDLGREMDRLGVDSNRVVLERIPALDEDTWL